MFFLRFFPKRFWGNFHNIQKIGCYEYWWKGVVWEIQKRRSWWFEGLFSNKKKINEEKIRTLAGNNQSLSQLVGSVNIYIVNDLLLLILTLSD